MEPMPAMSREAYVARMQELAQEILGQVADAINHAPDGHIIAASEEKVRTLFGEFRRQAFETGLQMRITAAEAAFPPSGGPGDPTQAPPQGSPGVFAADR